MISNSLMVQEIGGEVALEMRLEPFERWQEMVGRVADLLAEKHPEMVPEDQTLDWFSMMCGAAMWECVRRFEDDEIS